MWSWHANNLLWYGASYLHFDERAVFGIWVDCAVGDCGQGLPAAARRYLGKELAAVAPGEIRGLVRHVRYPARNIPGR
jgi:hypothetical protein